MDDDKIIELFESRSEASIAELSKKYGGICRTVAQNILGDFTETEQCLNDAYFRVWNSIPPAKPSSLSAFAAAVTRGLALMRLREMRAEKRGGGTSALSFDELGDYVSGSSSVESEFERREMIKAINEFLYKQPEKRRQLFIRRYWSCYGISELAAYFGMSESNVTVTLTRIRKKLKEYLRKRGFEL
ncbi:MAG: sigma-70 family RNA polymerase sigma factor [Oscillospiraceae bacterium]|nr:sigma-70 family RNA polymerase sigma factor [Oscillospiraceae bacterium]